MVSVFTEYLNLHVKSLPSSLSLSLFPPSLSPQFSSSYAITMMFPFAPFMVKFLLPYLDETDVGKFSGASELPAALTGSYYSWLVCSVQQANLLYMQKFSVDFKHSTDAPSSPRLFLQVTT